MSTWSDYDYQNGEFRILCTQNREFWLSKPLAACFGSIWRILKKSKNLKFFFFALPKIFSHSVWMPFDSSIWPFSVFFGEKNVFFGREHPQKPISKALQALLQTLIQNKKNRKQNRKFFYFFRQKFFFLICQKFFLMVFGGHLLPQIGYFSIFQEIKLHSKRTLRAQ